MAKTLSKSDLTSLFNGWKGKFELSKITGKILFVEMIYEIDHVHDFSKSLLVIEELEKNYGHQIPYEFDTENNRMIIKVKVTSQTLQDFLKIKSNFNEINKKLTAIA